MLLLDLILFRIKIILVNNIRFWTDKLRLVVGLNILIDFINKLLVRL